MRISSPSPQPATAPVLTRLDWDSRHFEFPVASLDGRAAADGDIAARLAEAVDEKIAVVYLFTDQGRVAAFELCDRFGGAPICRRIRYARTFGADRPRFARDDEARAGLQIIDRSRQPAGIGLRQLAIVASAYSRFRLDRRFPSEKVDGLYEIWMTRSSLGEIAEVVYVAETPGGEQVGVVTAATKQGRAEIGLLAVDARYRGKGLALSLIDAVDDWARRRQLRAIAVVTQMENEPACRLYERAGFQVDSIQQVTHFWLTPSAGSEGFLK